METVSTDTASMTPPCLAIPWTGVSEYPSRIAARNELRGWELPKGQLDALEAQFRGVDHAGRLAPAGVTMWLGKDLSFNRAEAIAWLKDEVEARGYVFVDYTGEGRTTFRKGSEQMGGKSVTACGLDLSKPTSGIVSKNILADARHWPGLEVFWLLALNPEVFLSIDYKSIPWLLAPGLLIDSDRLPSFHRYGNVMYLYGEIPGNAWSGAATVDFREL